MSEIKVNSIKGVGASTAAITVNNTDGTCTANITNRTNKRLTINGAMTIAQRGSSSTTSGYATVDRFAVTYGGTDEAPTQAQVDVGSGTTPYNLGFTKALRVTNGNQTSGAGAADYIEIGHRIEAQDIRNSGWNYLSSSSFITLSFYVKSSVAQVFYGYLTTRDGTRKTYPFSTGSLSADTWTKVTKVIAGNSGLTFDNDNGDGLDIFIDPYYGTDYTTNGVSLDQWNAHSAGDTFPDNTTTWYTTNDATFEITGVQLEVSDHATDFEHRSFADELKSCQRYYQQISRSSGANSVNGTFAAGTCNTNAGNGGILQVMVRFETKMRAVPTMTDSGTFSFHVSGVNVADTSTAYSQAYDDGVKITATQTAFISTSGFCGELISKYSDTSTATIKADAEL